MLARLYVAAACLVLGLGSACGDDAADANGTGTTNGSNGSNGSVVNGEADAGPDGDPDAAAPVDAGPNTDADAGVPDAQTPDATAEPECTENADCSGATPFCDLAVSECAAAPRGGLIGWGDGSFESVDFEAIYASGNVDHATDLAFNPAGNNEIWVSHRYAPNELPCDAPPTGGTSGCFALQGSTTTIFDAGTAQQTSTWIMDFNAWHFMRRPPAIAWGDDGFFATCGEARTGNYLDSGPDFIGPSLWTSDPEIYRNWDVNSAPRGWNGTHMDMLHASPYCMGIAHESGNAYWVANGQIGSFDRYDFNEDHGPGQADHSDGEVFRYVPGTLTRVPFVPGHLEFHDGLIYAADTGGGRIVSFDPTGAVEVGGIEPQYEPLRRSSSFEGGTVTELVSPGGILDTPSGLAIHDDVLYVSDNATSQIHAFELDGTWLRSLDTGLPAGSLAGIEVSPDGQMYFVNMPRAEVLRIIPK